MPRIFTTQQRECLDRITNSKRNATRRQLSRKDRYIATECTACFNFYSKDIIVRHWEQMNENEQIRGTTNKHDLNIKQKFWELDINGKRMKFLFLSTLTGKKLDQSANKRVITKGKSSNSPVTNDSNSNSNSKISETNTITITEAADPSKEDMTVVTTDYNNDINENDITEDEKHETDDIIEDGSDHESDEKLDILDITPTGAGIRATKDLVLDTKRKKSKTIQSTLEQAWDELKRLKKEKPTTFDTPEAKLTYEMEVLALHLKLKEEKIHKVDASLMTFNNCLLFWWLLC